MTHELLAHLGDRYTFDATPPYDDLGAYHVAFDDLTATERVETRIIRGAERGERIALIADSGSGKSSVISHVLGPAAERVAPIVVPIRPLETAAKSPVRVADELLTLLARYAEQVGAAGPDDLKGSLGADRKLTHSHRNSGGVSLSLRWLRGDLARDVTRQVQTEEHISLPEKTDALAQAFERIRRDELQPVVVFDDTDRWVPDDDRDTVEGFFREIVRWLADLRVSVVVAAHPRYLEGSTNRDHLLEFLDTQVTIPRLPDEAALARILERRIALNVEHVDEYREAGLHDAITPEAVTALYQAYKAGRPLRKIIQLTHIALGDANSVAANVITADHVSTAFQFE